MNRHYGHSLITHSGPSLRKKLERMWNLSNSEIQHFSHKNSEIIKIK